MTAALLLALAAAPPADAAAFPDPALVERTADRRPQFNYREANVPAYELPDVLGDADDAADLAGSAGGTGAAVRAARLRRRPAGAGGN